MSHAMHHVAGMEFFSILVLPICVYLHFRSHHITSQIIVNQAEVLLLLVSSMLLYLLRHILDSYMLYWYE